jgi:hypothetical protein
MNPSRPFFELALLLEIHACACIDCAEDGSTLDGSATATATLIRPLTE